MASDPRTVATIFTQLDTTLSAHPGSAASGLSHEAEQTRLLREILNGQDRQNELLEELISQVGAHHRQRQAELGQWKQANPGLAKSCKLAADALSKVQAEFLDSLTREQMQELLVSIWARTDKRIFFITHSIEEALFLGTEVLVMSPRPGRVVARFELDFVHRFAASGDTRAIVTSPEFGNLREEIRGILHNADTIRSAA